MVDNSADSNNPNKRLSNNKFSNLSDAHGADMNMAAEQQPLPVLVMDSDDFPNQGAQGNQDKVEHNIQPRMPYIEDLIHQSKKKANPIEEPTQKAVVQQEIIAEPVVEPEQAAVQ